MNAKRLIILFGACILSPFLRVDTVAAQSPRAYPPLRRMRTFPTSLRDAKIQPPLALSAFPSSMASFQTLPQPSVARPDYLSPDMLFAAGRLLKELPSFTSTISRLRCTGIELHSAHHRFLLFGERCHLQMNCYLKGIKGSGFQMRLPLPDRFCPSPRTGMKSSGSRSDFSSPSSTLASSARRTSSLSLSFSRASVWDRFSVLPRSIYASKYRLIDFGRMKHTAVQSK